MAEIGIIRERHGDVENDLHYLLQLAHEGHIKYLGVRKIAGGDLVHYFIPIWDVE